MHDISGREKKAKTMIAVLSHFLQKDLSLLSLLDVGASTGIIDNYLSNYFKNVTGIDIDEKAIEFAKNKYKKDNMNFFVDDAMRLSFSDSTFDVVVCSQIYEHVPDAGKLMSEIYRVLKSGGICYFAAGNRFDIKEHHYNLPFLSVIPKPISHLYLRIAGRGKFYYEKHLSFWGLKKLVMDFELYDYTKNLIETPDLFNIEYMLKPNSIKNKIAKIIINYAYWLCPGYIWILKKV